MLTRIKTTIREFPLEFRVLTIANFIDSVGRTMVFPFFALYVTQKFNAGMTQAGVLLAIFSIFGFAGSVLGGALADKFGRRNLVLLGLLFSAFSSLAMGLVSDLYLFYVLAAVAGLLSDIAGPAHQAMVADLLPEEQRAEGYGVMRVAGNLAWIIGPTIGGILVARSYLLLFVLDAVSSVITAVIFYKLVPETKPAEKEEAPQQSLMSTLAGYRAVFADKLYIAFVLVAILMLIPYMQIYSTLSVYLYDVHGVPARGYGFLMSLNAGFVVLFQFWLTRRVKGIAPLLLLAAGSLLFMVGLAMYGLVAGYALFAVAMVIITFGEMLALPEGQTLAANFAPADMRGRYLAIFGLSWTIAGSVGPLAAGVIMDNYNPDWVWYAAGVISAAAAAGFMALHFATRSRLAALEDAPQADTAVSSD